jgi:hypothetical protein
MVKSVQTTSIRFVDTSPAIEAKLGTISPLTALFAEKLMRIDDRAHATKQEVKKGKFTLNDGTDKLSVVYTRQASKTTVDYEFSLTPSTIHDTSRIKGYDTALGMNITKEVTPLGTIVQRYFPAE